MQPASCFEVFHGAGTEKEMTAIYGRCRFCGKALTRREWLVLKDQCWDCTNEIGT